MRLSKREKTLLIVLAVFAVFALFIAYALLPAISARTAEKVALGDLETQIVEQQAEYVEYQNNKRELEEQDKLAGDLYGELYNEKTYDTGLLLSDMLARYSLTPLNLDIDGRVRSTLMDTVDETGAAVTVNTQYAYCREVTLSFTGPRANADAFINAISEYNTRYLLHGVNMVHSDERTDYTIQLTLYEFEESAAPIEAAGEQVQ